MYSVESVTISLGKRGLPGMEVSATEDKSFLPEVSVKAVRALRSLSFYGQYI